MPLHDWRDDRGWDSLHLAWQNQLLDWVQPRLPQGYRAYFGSVPGLTIGAPNGRPDLGVRNWQPASAEAVATTSEMVQPDFELPATMTLDDEHAVHIDLHGQLIAAIEIVSPRNKDRPDSRERYTRRYFGYIRQGVHLLLVDVLPRPAGFSFADAVAADIGLAQPLCPVPFAVSFRVGESVPEGTLVAVWRRPMVIGVELPTIPLALNVREAVPINLEHTYREAAKRIYLD